MVSIETLIKNDESKAIRNPYILKWTHEDMILSDGSKFKEFTSHNEALDALDAEIAKVRLPEAKKVIKIGVDTDEYYRVVQLEVVREESRGLMLSGVSEYYIRPLYGETAMPIIRFLGSTYRNVNGKYNDDDTEMPWTFFSKSLIGECVNYYEHILFHTETGFIAAYRDDLTNYTAV